MINTLYCSRFRRNLNSVIRTLTQPSGPEAIQVQKRCGGDSFYVLSARQYQELVDLELKSEASRNLVEIEGLKRTVPIIQHAYTPYVRLIDIPNPWRSEFFSDALGMGCPVIPGEGPCYYAWDWNKWLDFRSKSRRRTRFGGPVNQISDEEASMPVKAIDNGSSKEESE